VDATNTYTVIRKYDGMGRQQQISAGGILTDTVYTAMNETWSSTPYQGTETKYYSKTQTDALGRTKLVTAPDGTTTTYAYDDQQTTVTDALGHVTTTNTDLRGRATNVAPPAGPSVNYTYDEMDRMITVVRGPSSSVTIGYDQSGRKTSLTDPDLGYWTYTYDALNNMKTQTDARSCTTNLDYDSLNRPVQKSYSNCPATATVTYGYDSGVNGKGRRTSMNDDTGSATWLYDARGQMTKETKVFNNNGGTFVTQWAYNDAGLPTSMMYPGGADGSNGEAVNYLYDSKKLLAQVNSIQGTYMQSTLYDSASRMTDRTFGNGLAQKYIYFAWDTQGGRLDKMAAGTGAWNATTLTFANSLQKTTYTYDAVSNIKTITDASNSSQKQCFQYDDLDRLTKATTYNDSPQGCTSQLGQGNYDETYSYDTNTGNLAGKAGVDYTYNTTHKHAVASLSNGNTYSYDANGNTIARHITSGLDMGDYALTYDAENRLTQVDKTVSGVTTTVALFTFDGDGKRVKSVAGSETTLFVGSHYEMTGSSVTKYYFAGAQRIAMRSCTGGTCSAPTYLAGDHLGSTSLVTDASGALITKTLYKPCPLRYRYGVLREGEVRYNTPNTTLSTRYTYTGQYSYISDDATDLGSNGFGLMYYGARMYDPALSRFSSADTIVPGGVQGYDRYAYVNNNPMRYNDPTGHECSDPDAPNRVCERGSQYVPAPGVADTRESYEDDTVDIWDKENTRASDKGKEMIKDFEGTCATDPNKPCSDNPDDPENGYCTVGHGHKLHFGPCTVDDMSQNYDIEELWSTDLAQAEKSVRQMFQEMDKAGNPVSLTQAQFDALVDLSFNLGSGTFAGLINASNVNDKFDSKTFSNLMLGRYAQGDPGILPRRQAELNLFMYGIYP
jgi:RHS repeat-associated protein